MNFLSISCWPELVPFALHDAWFAQLDMTDEFLTKMEEEYDKQLTAASSLRLAQSHIGAECVVAVEEGQGDDDEMTADEEEDDDDEAEEEEDADDDEEEDDEAEAEDEDDEEMDGEASGNSN
mmetsp:Transcript_11281/g.22618  ORF Transcript_11281/g.22618 Transcript_11281/m.22618 type:complete len:122 (-) Transcript_11281:477-842(-)